MNQKIKAYSKINLTLNITGKRHDGYHTLKSLVSFTNLADEIIVEELSSDQLKANDDNLQDQLIIKGDYANKLKNSLNQANENLIFKALGYYRSYINTSSAKNNVHYKVELIKNLPISSGIGGGSANAAAIIKALLLISPPNAIQKAAIINNLVHLGADVPVCFYTKPCIMSGVGEVIEPVNLRSKLNLLLVNPNKVISTKEVFSKFQLSCDNAASPYDTLPNFSNLDNLIGFIKKCSNDLQNLSQEIEPDIKDIIAIMKEQENCKLAQMSGSGATCFAIFSDKKSMINAKVQIKAIKPNWWVKSSQTI